MARVFSGRAVRSEASVGSHKQGRRDELTPIKRIGNHPETKVPHTAKRQSVETYVLTVPETFYLDLENKNAPPSRGGCSLWEAPQVFEGEPVFRIGSRLCPRRSPIGSESKVVAKL
jgi:hypothetical protein